MFFIGGGSMSKKNIDRCYIVIQFFFMTVAIVLFFIIGWLFINEFSSENGIVHHELSNIIKHVDNGFENDELLKVFYDINKECDGQSAKNVDSVPENELNELYHFLTQNYAHTKLDAQSQFGRYLVMCAISAAEELGVPADMLTEFINYTLTAATHSPRHFDPDAFLVYAAESFVTNHNDYEVEDYNSSLIYNSLGVIFEFVVYFLLIMFLFLLIRIERNTRE